MLPVWVSRSSVFVWKSPTFDSGFHTVVCSVAAFGWARVALVGVLERRVGGLFTFVSSSEPRPRKCGMGAGSLSLGAHSIKNIGGWLGRGLGALGTGEWGAGAALGSSGPPPEV